MKAMHVCLVAMAIALAACSGGKSSVVSLDDMPVVTHQEMKDGQEVTVCDLELITDTIDLPLSYFVEDLQMIRLDNRDEALVGNGPVSVSDNYLLIAKSSNVPYKLFRRDGSYVGNVGGIGQGPGEYTMIYDVQIDEKGGRIYMLPWNATSILVYDLQGKFVKNIPLNKKYEKLRVPKGRIKVDAENNRIGVVLLPFDYLPVVAWVQDMEGNFICETSTEHYKVRPDFSNEVLSLKATDELSVLITGLNAVFIHHLDMEKGSLKPVFRSDSGSKELQIHFYNEYPYHYNGTIAEIKRVSERATTASGHKFYLVDKQTGKGCFYRLYNDWLGDAPVSWLEGLDGYYTLNIEPSALFDLLEKVLKENTSLDGERRKKLEELKASIDEDDNNYVFVGKLTPPPSEVKTFVKPESEKEEKAEAMAFTEDEPIVPGIRYEATVKNGGGIRLDIEKALKNVRPMKMSEVGSSVKFAQLWAVDNSVPVPYKDGYLFLDTEGLYLLDSAYQKKRMLVKNVCHFVLHEKTYAYTYKYTLCKPLRVDEEKGIIQCQFRARKEASGMATFSLEKLMQSDSVLHTKDFQSFSPEMYPLLFTSDGFVTYKKNTGTFYTHTFRGDTLCRFQLMPDYLPKSDYRNGEKFSAYSLNGQHFIRLPYDDTVYRLVDNHTLQAVYQLDFGSLHHATGKEVVGGANIDHAYQVKEWIEGDKFIFIRVAQGHDSPNSRKENAVKLYTLVYNKETQEFFSLPQPKELAYAALEGDLLGGMEWWPQAYQDGKLYRYCSSKLLKEHPSLLEQVEGLEDLKDSEWIMVILE